MTELEQYQYYLMYLKVEKINKELELYSEVEPFEVIANYQIERMLDNLQAVKKGNKIIIGYDLLGDAILNI